MSNNAPHIPIDVFRKMIETMSADELAQLPPEKLPEKIPVDLVDEAPIYSRGALESLILASNSYHLQRRMELQERYGEEVMDAMDRSKTMLNTATLRVFKNKLDDMQKVRKRWHETRDKDKRDLLIKSIKNMQGQVLDVRAENARLTQAIRLLNETRPILATDTQILEENISQLKKGSEYIERRLAEFFLLRLEALNTEMQQRYKEILSFEEDAAILDHEIESLREKLERSQNVWKRTFKRDQANHEMEELQTLISTLVAERQNKEGAISENNLTIWLDTIVDASVHPFTRDKVQKVMGVARRALFYLLSKYCAQQEQSAMQIARNPFLQIDAKQAIKYMLMSEEFILDYFTKKKSKNAAWISDAAQVKMEDLDQLEKDILGELKRSSKFQRL
jgi:hypothetical protein